MRGIMADAPCWGASDLPAGRLGNFPPAGRLRSHGFKPVRARSGTVLMDFVMCFPLVLVLMLFIVQFAHLWIARQVVQYAAYQAARSALVHSCVQADPNVVLESLPFRAELPFLGFDPAYTLGSSLGAGYGGEARTEAEYFASETAARICSAITLSESIWDQANRNADDGRSSGFNAARRKTRAVVDFDPATWNVRAAVEHDFALVVPIVGQMLGWGLTLWDKQWQAGARPAYQVDLDETGNAHAGLDVIPYPHIRLTGTVWMSKPYRTFIATENWRGYP